MSLALDSPTFLPLRVMGTFSHAYLSRSVAEISSPIPLFHEPNA